MSEQPMTPEPCEHHWISYKQPSHSPIRWIVKCSQCHQFNISELQAEIDVIEAAAEQRGAVWALRQAANESYGLEFWPSDWLNEKADQMEDDDADA